MLCKIRWSTPSCRDAVAGVAPSTPTTDGLVRPGRLVAVNSRQEATFASGRQSGSVCASRRPVLTPSIHKRRPEWMGILASEAEKDRREVWPKTPCEVHFVGNRPPPCTSAKQSSEERRHSNASFPQPAFRLRVARGRLRLVVTRLPNLRPAIGRPRTGPGPCACSCLSWNPKALIRRRGQKLRTEMLSFFFLPEILS
jgi:hypothetical protein